MIFNHSWQIFSENSEFPTSTVNTQIIINVRRSYCLLSCKVIRNDVHVLHIVVNLGEGFQPRLTPPPAAAAGTRRPGIAAAVIVNVVTIIVRTTVSGDGVLVVVGMTPRSYQPRPITPRNRVTVGVALSYAVQIGRSADRNATDCTRFNIFRPRRVRED